jgi:hypothetical protein
MGLAGRLSQVEQQAHEAEALNLKNEPTSLVRGTVEGSNPSGPATDEARHSSPDGLV